MSQDTGAVSPAAPTGQQFTIAHGPFEATVVEVGGGLRGFTRDGVPVVAGYDAGDQCRSGRGQQLMPWPNRIRDGRYEFAGRAEQLALTEVSRRNASHGLVRWSLWELLEDEGDSVTVRYRLHPQPGWPHHLDLRTTYTLDDTGLVVTPAARNVGDGPAPFGYGAHPYLSIGMVPIEDVELRVPASTWLAADDRMLPTDSHPVEGTRYDFRSGRRVGPEILDTAYTDVRRDDDGMWRCRVQSDTFGSVSLWADAAFPWLQVFTGAAHQGKGAPGIAVEPMTCPADAFNSGVGLLVLEPGQEWTGTWGIHPG
ncbi:MAG: aldose 1-epimerase family protein [Intrasporangium sp.]|uniref:aldose 1-epimerase family protein n=1 Tax=Intrasporangium sp. TaxID=1925024 RepID=UPI0026478553|nr:aldose 1-epimerase family protein [Intrasporangium sp.]MDN5797030.1 aldose 1-epimerase family protein [Intrasporangium sp.]